MLERGKQLVDEHGWLLATVAAIGLATIAALYWFSDNLVDVLDTDQDGTDDDVDDQDDATDVELNAETGVPVDR